MATPAAVMLQSSAAHCSMIFATAPRRPASSSLSLGRHSSPVCLASSLEDEVEEVDIDFEDGQGQPLVAPQPSTSYQVPEDDAESRALAIAFAKVAWETKGEDVVVLHVAPLVYWTRYMVISTVFSKPQLQAILAKVEKEAEEKHDRRAAAPASGRSAWELLDFGDVVVHVMTAEQRDYYDLESFYGAAEELDLPFLREGNQGPAWETKL